MLEFTIYSISITIFKRDQCLDVVPENVPIAVIDMFIQTLL